MRELFKCGLLFASAVVIVVCLPMWGIALLAVPAAACIIDDVHLRIYGLVRCTVAYVLVLSGIALLMHFSLIGCIFAELAMFGLAFSMKNEFTARWCAFRGEERDLFAQLWRWRRWLSAEAAQDRQMKAFFKWARERR